MAYIVLSNIRHNDKEYAAGDLISELTADQAQTLIASGAIEVSEVPAEVEAPANELTVPEEATAEVPAGQEAPAPEAPLEQPPQEPEVPPETVPADSSEGSEPVTIPDEPVTPPTDEEVAKTAEQFK